LIHGRTYFARLAETLETLAPGDLVCLADWRGDDDEKLTDDGPTLAGVLMQLARRGVDVRGLLWRSHPRLLGFSEEAETELAAIRERWNDPTPLEHRSSPLARIRLRKTKEPNAPAPLPPADPPRRPHGTHAVQVLRTYPGRRPPYPFAPQGERTIARFYRKA